MKPETKPQHGGARASAGRKPKDESEKRVPLSARVDPATKARLEGIAAQKHISVGQLIDEMTRCFDGPLIVD